MSDAASPISGDEFAALMAATGPYGRERRVLVAVSGGADSMALALLLAGWGQPVAAIVDHGLRSESAAEAALVSARLTGLGVENHVLTTAVATGPALAERARVARYDLLYEAAARFGLPDLLLGHHAGDQAETVRMRLDAGSGAAGLAGMVPVSYRNAVRLTRPLLAIDPARLRATLRRAGVDWVEDPTNQDVRTARGRLRRDMTAADRVEALALAEVSLVERRRHLCEIACALADVRLAPEGYAVAKAELGGAALSALIWMVSGRAYPPPFATLEPGLAPRTLHGVLIRPAGRFGPGTLLTREPASVAPPIGVSDDAWWDGRFRVRGAAAGLTIGALGAEASSLRRHSHLPAVVLATVPALRRGSAVVAVPHLAFPDREACRSVSVELWPRRQAAPST